MTGDLVVAGVDLSLASTGVARLDWPEGGDAPSNRTFRIQSEAPSNATVDEQADRMLDIRCRIAQATAGARLVLLEGPATGLASNAGGFALWGLWWQVAADLRQAGCRVAKASPSTLKVYAVGFGGSAKQKVSKADVRRAVEQRYPGLLTGGSHDVADAIVLAAMAARAAGRPIDEPLPPTHLRAMTSVRWPTLERTKP